MQRRHAYPTAFILVHPSGKSIPTCIRRRGWWTSSSPAGRLGRYLEEARQQKLTFFATIITIMWTSIQPLEMWLSFQKVHQRSYFNPPFESKIKTILQPSGSGKKIQRKGSWFCSVSALGKIWHVTLFRSSGIPDSQSMTKMNLFLRTYL